MTPAPDGRGPKKPDQPRTGRNQRILLVAVVVGLLALNLWVSSQALKPNPRMERVA